VFINYAQGQLYFALEVLITNIKIVSLGPPRSVGNEILVLSSFAHPSILSSVCIHTFISIHAFISHSVENGGRDMQTEYETYTKSKQK
jgi:hypothetical protein